LGRTLFQMLRTRAAGPAELSVYNPLHIRLGHAVRIDTIDLRGKNYKVVGLKEYNRLIDSRKYQFVDYELSCDTEKIRLRLNPMADPDPVSGLTHNVVLLSLYYECSYQEAKDTGLDSSVNTGEFDVNWNDTNRKYFRINESLRTPYTAEVKTLEDLDGNGQVDEDEISSQTVQFWDYHTELYDEANQPYVELLFVERANDTGFWQIWRGSEVDPDRVAVS
jgi:hypothetical protein